MEVYKVDDKQQILGRDVNFYYSLKDSVSIVNNKMSMTEHSLLMA